MSALKIMVAVNTTVPTQLVGLNAPVMMVMREMGSYAMVWHIIHRD